MPKQSMWWLFLLLFGLTIGGIQSLGWWVRPAQAQSQTASTGGSCTVNSAAALRHQNCDATHWRAYLMQQ